MTDPIEQLKDDQEFCKEKAQDVAAAMEMVHRVMSDCDQREGFKTAALILGKALTNLGSARVGFLTIARMAALAEEEREK